MKRYFCTYFDSNYMLYGLTMFRSLCNVCPDFRLFVLCLNDEAYEKLNTLDERILPISLVELEKYDSELLSIKKSRSIVEYYFTISPCLPLFLFHEFPELDYLTYLDSDLFFFSSPECLYEELGDKSVLLCKHNYSNNIKKNCEIFGTFNVAFQIYKNDEKCYACLKWWRKRCLEWCFDRVECGRFADQKYLDEMYTNNIDSIVASKNPGADVAPWNMSEYSFVFNNNISTVNGLPLVFLHYQAFRLLDEDFVRWPLMYGDISTQVWRFFARKYYLSLLDTYNHYKEIFPRFFSPDNTIRMSIKIKDNYARICNIFSDARVRQKAKLLYMSFFSRKEGIAYHGIRFF